MNDRLSLRGFLLFVSIFAILFLTGCHPTSLPSDWGIPPQETEGDPLSIPVILLADNQLHHLYGNPVWLRSGFTNQFVAVAIRPVQLDFYAPDILKWIIKNYANRRRVIHLGDALNIACSVEFDAFEQIMNESGKGWVLAPGNHDFYYFGNGHFAWDEWVRACKTQNGNGRPMTKDLFIESYLNSLAEQSQKFNNFGFADSVPLKEGYWETPEDQAPFLSGIVWKIDKDDPWRSFVVQRLNLTLPGNTTSSHKPGGPVIAILLDTNQYDIAPGLLPIIRKNSGVTGGLLDDQIKIIDEWLANQPQGQTTIIMGHHPYHTLTRTAREAIDRWRTDRGVALYVSAHTHKANYYVREGSDANWLELNIGSTTDWPPEFRTLTVSSARGYDQKVAFRMPRLPVHALWEDLQIPRCEPEWEVTTDREDFYINYAELTTPDPKKTQIALMNILLRSYEWLLRFVESSPTNKTWPDGTKNDQEVLKKIDHTLNQTKDLDQKLNFLRQLHFFETNRNVKDQILQHEFHLCQAKWASKYDLHGARVPNVDDAYILIPKE